jgi:hypothetical protein
VYYIGKELSDTGVAAVAEALRPVKMPDSAWTSNPYLTSLSLSGNSAVVERVVTLTLAPHRVVQQCIMHSVCDASIASKVSRSISGYVRKP